MSTAQERRDELTVIAADLDQIGRKLAVLGHEAHEAGELVAVVRIDHARDDVILAQAKLERLT